MTQDTTTPQTGFQKRLLHHTVPKIAALNCLADEINSKTHLVVDASSSSLSDRALAQPSRGWWYLVSPVVLYMTPIFSWTPSGCSLGQQPELTDRPRRATRVPLPYGVLSWWPRCLNRDSGNALTLFRAPAVTPAWSEVHCTGIMGSDDRYSLCTCCCTLSTASRCDVDDAVTGGLL